MTGKSRSRFFLNRRQSTLLFLLVSLVILAGITVAGVLLEEQAAATDFTRTNLAPGRAFWFGTDWMGRDMFIRTIAGLSLSIRIGALTAAVSAAAALVLGTAAATLGRRADSVISWCIDLVMGIPHILLVMLISIACGRGFAGVVAGVSLSHWPSLARGDPGGSAAASNAPYILVAEKLGVSKLQIAGRHMLPHLFPRVSHRADPSVPSRHPSTRPASRSWASGCPLSSRPSRDPVGEHAVSDHGAVVAGPLSGTLPCAGGGAFRPAGRAGAVSAGPVQRPLSRQGE